VNCVVSRPDTAFSAPVPAKNTVFRRRFRQSRQKNAGFSHAA
jgi:hypothetical protein